MESSTRAASELEGTTLDLDQNHRSEDLRQLALKKTRNKRSSGVGSSGGGFLLDSVYHTNQRHVSHAKGTPANTEIEKRRYVDDEIKVSKRRAASERENDTLNPVSIQKSPLGAVTNAAASEGHGSGQNDSANSRQASSRNSYTSNVGLDTDPVQIVNLALNLSESRRRATNAGRVPSSPLPGIARSSSTNPMLLSSLDNSSRSLGGNKALRHSSLYANDNSISRNLDSLTSTQPHALVLNSNGVAAMLPISQLPDVDIICTQATLSRVEKAKQHFELFSKYLELLSYLPPLQHPAHYGRSTGGRIYNPLQSIRNRKIRLREKNIQKIDHEGWQDLSKVDDWLASIEITHEPNNNDPYECLALPPFHAESEEKPDEIEESWNPTASPPSSVRGTNRSGSIKITRPRLEWAISPAELFEDAVWVESATNKAKIYDREGRKLYPDSSKLKFAGSSLSAERPESIIQSHTTPKKQPFIFPSFNNLARDSPAGLDNHPSGHADGDFSRGRSAGADRAPKWTRSTSLSDDSSSDDFISRGRARRISKKAKMKVEAAMQGEKLHKVLHGHSDSSNAGSSKRSKPFSQRSSVKAGETVEKEKTQRLISPASSVTGKEGHRTSMDEMDSTAPNSPVQGPIFPSITVNLSPPSSRSPSPQKRLPRIMETLHERTKSRRNMHPLHEEVINEDPSSTSQLRQPATTVNIDMRDGISPRTLDPSPLPETPLEKDELSLDYFERSDTHGSFKPQPNSESRLKGFLKNSRIAEIVGSEVSKVGDMIRRKDVGVHSRQSSYASSIVSDTRTDDERSGEESTPGKRNSLRRGSTFSDEESGGLSRRKMNGRSSTKSFISNLPNIGPALRVKEQKDESPSPDRLLQPGHSRVSDVHFVRAHPDLPPASSVETSPYSDRRDSYGFVPTPTRASKKVDKAKGPAAILPGIERTIRPPVTGLAKAEISTMATNRRPSLNTLGGASHGWSLSDRSVPTINDMNSFQKREILRCQALLLSSGVKASEIVHRYEKPREYSSSSSPSISAITLSGATAAIPKFLINSLVDPKAPIPHSLPRIDEFNYAARNLLERLETTKTNLNKSMYLFSKTTLFPLQSEIDSLEDLIANKLTPRVRTAAFEAETLSTQLNTTSTLEIKQLSERLDKGIRKRNRRLRSIRRLGFSLLEWTLVGVMWWLWLIVMVFKILRGIGKGVVQGVRWILWL